MAEKIYQGDFGSALSKTYHPLYPMLIAGLYGLLGDFETSAIIISVLGSTLATIPIYYFVHAVWSRTIALIVLLLYAFHPLIVDLHADVMTEGIYIFFISCAIALIWETIRWMSPVSAILAAFASVCTYLTRVEGIIVIALFTCWAPLSRLTGQRAWGKIVLNMLIYYSVVTVLAYPYLVWVRTKTGVWHFTAKHSAIITLTGEWEPGLDPGRMTQQAQMQNRYGKVGGTVLFSSKLLLKSASWIWGPFLIFYLLFLLPRIFSLKLRQNIPKIYLLTFSLPYIVAVVIGGSRGVDLSYRYFLTPLLWLSPWAACGITNIGDWLSTRVHGSKRPVIFYLILLSVIISTIPKITAPRRLESIGFKEAGLWLNKNTQAEALILTSRQAVGYYAKREIMYMRCRYEYVVQDCQKRGADYAVFCQKDLAKMDKDFLVKLASNPRFKLIKTFPSKLTDKTHTVYLFKYIK
jgi:4-amino-4-deoxy-L-arabinose transferase-like glycosyltransferase